METARLIRTNERQLLTSIGSVRADIAWGCDAAYMPVPGRAVTF